MTIEDLEYGAPPDSGRSSGGGFDRTPPQDLEAERSVLGGMMISKDAIADVIEQIKGATSTAPRTRRSTTPSSTCTAAASPPTRSPSRTS